MVYDVVIIGAGVAGISCAIALKKYGISCIILNKATRTKACGGGITHKSLELLSRLGISASEFLNKDAKIIKYSKQILKNGDIKITDYTTRRPINFSVGMSREKFDEVLRRKAVQIGIPIETNYSEDSIFIGEHINDSKYPYKKIVFATGAANSMNYKIDKKIYRTFGVSMEVGAALNIADDTFYFYMENDNYDDNYNWIFPIGTNRWNIGVWRKDNPLFIKSIFEKFYKEVFLPKADKMILPGELKGGYINCGHCSFYKKDDSVYYIGDCAGCSNIKNGEGIYQAVKTGIDAANDIYLTL